MCPMRFNRFPLDEHICQFRVGSVNVDDTRMTFDNEKLDFDPKGGTTILDYQESCRTAIKYTTYYPIPNELRLWFA